MPRKSRSNLSSISCGKKKRKLKNLLRAARSIKNTQQGPLNVFPSKNEFEWNIPDLDYDPNYNPRAEANYDWSDEQFDDKVNIKIEPPDIADSSPEHTPTVYNIEPIIDIKCEPLLSEVESEESNDHIEDTEHFHCLICPKLFLSKRLLYNHIVYHGRTRKLYKCDRCRKKYIRKHNLTAHRLTHAKQKPNTRNNRFRTFTYQHQLTEHTSTHVKEKLFACNICDKQFDEIRQLSIHIRRHSVKKGKKTLKYKTTLCSSEDVQDRGRTSVMSAVNVSPKNEYHNINNKNEALRVKKELDINDRLV